MMEQLAAWTELLADERLPAVLVDLDAFDRNAARIEEIMRRAPLKQTLRVASKSLRVPALLRRILDRGAPYHGLMCFSAEEAAFLAEEGFDDLLIAYPTYRDSDLQLLRELHESGRKISLVTDSLQGICRVNDFMTGVSQPFALVLEVDLALRLFGGLAHLGARRSPLRSVTAVVKVFEEARSLEHVSLIGLMGYESQVAGMGDLNPVNRLLNPIIRRIRAISVRRMARFRSEVRASLEAKGHKIQIFNGGGTGSLSYAVIEPALTELTAGSGYLNPHLFDWYTNLSLEPACFFALQAVRQPDPGWVTCAGGGYIASGKPGWDKVPVPFFPHDAKLSGDEGCGEVQTPLKVGKGTKLRMGDPVFFRHAKGGELAERFTEYLLVSGGKIVERAPTYRGSGQCFF